jgi:hypothetical protein
MHGIGMHTDVDASQSSLHEMGSPPNQAAELAVAHRRFNELRL